MSDDRDVIKAARDRMVPEIKAALAVADFPIRVWPPDWEQKESISYFYRSASVLTRDADAERVARALRALPEPVDHGPGHNLETDSPVRGVTRFQVFNPDHFAPEQDPTPGIVDALESKLGPGVANHEHAFELTPWWHCPATEPEEVVPPGTPDLAEYLWPPQSTGDAGTGVHISVVDTGLLDGVAGWAPWLAGVTYDTAADIENPDTYDVQTHANTPDSYADPYAGHGSFIAGVIRCVAPATDVVVEGMIGPSGFVAEADMITQIRQGLSRSPDIISLSAGGHTRNDVPPLGLQELWNQRLSQQGGVVLVAAAGNQGTSRPFWPAAFEWAVGVGSMTRDGQQRSVFSNHGSWVDVYAPGEDIVNAYPQLKYRTIAGGTVRDTSAGIAQWSGTSFATPIVAALIAARMSRSGENGRTAADSVLAAARGQFRPGVGPRLFP